MYSVYLTIPLLMCLVFVVVQLLSHVWLFAIPGNCSMPGFLDLDYLPEFAQTHVHWVGDTIQPSCPLLPSFSSCPQSFPALGSFRMRQLFTSGGQSIGASASVSVLPMNKGWFPLWLTGLISLMSKGLSRVLSSTMIWKHQIFGVQSTLWFNSHIHTWLLEKL